MTRSAKFQCPFCKGMNQCKINKIKNKIPIKCSSCKKDMPYKYLEEFPSRETKRQVLGALK